MSDTIPEIRAPATFVDAYGDTLTVTGGSDITLHPIYTSDLDTNMLCFTRAEAKSLPCNPEK